MASQVASRLSRLVFLGAIVFGVLIVFSFAAGPPDAPTERSGGDAAEQLDPLSINAACYLCHIPFVKEELSKVHLEAKVTCIKCHGLSADHANDENVGATKPDIVFKRGQVDGMCVKCHEDHNAPARQVVARFIQRRLSPESTPVCTDCHGKHKIEEAAEKKDAKS